jgi:hypothetical protein
VLVGCAYSLIESPDNSRDGTAFWVPGGKDTMRISTTGQVLGSIYACSEGTWDLTWDGQYLWATQRTNENWFDDKLYQIQIGQLL